MLGLSEKHSGTCLYFCSCYLDKFSPQLYEAYYDEHDLTWISDLDDNKDSSNTQAEFMHCVSLCADTREVSYLSRKVALNLHTHSASKAIESALFELRRQSQQLRFKVSPPSASGTDSAPKRPKKRFNFTLFNRAPNPQAVKPRAITKPERCNPPAELTPQLQVDQARGLKFKNERRDAETSTQRLRSCK